MDIVSVVESLGIQVAMLVAMMYYIVYKDKAHREEMKDLRTEHKAEADGFAEAIRNNTEVMSRTNIVIERLCTIMTKEGADGLQ